MDREKRYEPLEVLFLFVLGLALRLSAGRNSLLGEGVLFDGYDPYYHMRRILYSIDHFPDTLWFDSYINYPRGLGLTWPPLFDQVVAAASLVLGQHSQHGVEIVGAVIPAILGALTVIAIYYLVREAFDRDTALAAGFMAAVAPFHIFKTLLGNTDHHALEVMAVMFALLFLVLAMSRPKRYLYAVASGVALAALAYTWLGATAYASIILVYAAVQMTMNLASGTSSKDTTATILIALVTSLVLMAPFWSTPWLQPSFLGVFALAVGVTVLYVLSRIMAGRNMPWAAFPATVVVLSGLFVLAARTFSDIWILSKVNSLVFSGGDYIFGGTLVGRVAEAEPLFARPESIFGSFGLTALGWSLLFSLAGMYVLAVHIRRSSPESQPGKVLLMVWAVSALALTLGQVRFIYLYSLAMAVLISILFFWARGQVRERTEERSHALLTILLVLVLALPSAWGGLMAAASGGSPQISGDWQESLVWLRENSEATSTDPSKTPEYSVFSWWDYGNWIIYVSERPVVANNFQAGAVDSARFYLSEGEGTASKILDEKRSRYVITEHDMLYGRFPAITNWVHEDPATYYRLESSGSSLIYTPLQRLYNTTLARLHFFEGSGMGRFRLIYESKTKYGTNPPTSRVKIFEYVPGALIRISAPDDAKVGAILNLTSNQGRPFQYINLGSEVGDHFEIKVPYSTEGRYETRSTGPYTLFAGGTDGIIYRSINISEKDVLEGRVIDIAF